MGWGEGSKCLICPERLDPESLGSRIPAVLLQAGAGPGGIGVDPAGIAEAPEVLPGGSDCGGGAQARMGKQGIDSLCFIFQASVQVRDSGLPRFSVVSRV